MMFNFSRPRQHFSKMTNGWTLNVYQLESSPNSTPNRPQTASQSRQRHTRNLLSSSINHKDLRVDVHEYKIDELSVRISNGSLNIQGHHAFYSEHEKASANYFSQQHEIPLDIDVSKITAEYFSTGYLVIRAPKMNDTPLDREVPITTVVPTPDHDCSKHTGNMKQL